MTASSSLIPSEGAISGPAQALHSTTLVIDARFMTDTLDANGMVAHSSQRPEASAERS